MVRDYSKKLGGRSYRNYTEDKVEEALAVVVTGELSIRAAAIKYKIPYGTLHNKYKGKHTKTSGGQTVFSKAEEFAILKAACKCADWGFPLDSFDLRMLAKSYLDRRGKRVAKFKNNLPGKDWALSLLKRHSNETTQRLYSNINRKRANISRQTLTKFFENLSELLSGVPSSNVFNYDETNVTDDPGKKKGIYRRGVKYPERILNHSKSAISIMMCGSADGCLLPPYVIYKSEHLYNTWKEGGIHGAPCCDKPCCSAGSRYNRTSHGWIDSNTFEDWFQSCFLPHARRLQGRKVLLGDNLASHFNPTVISLCEENDISFACLVPNSTHLCQPLDVAFFKPFKVAWRAILTEYKSKHNSNSGLPKDVFPGLLKAALEKMDGALAQSANKPGDSDTSAIKRNLKNGFYATGIFPLNSHKVLEKLPDDTATTPDDLVNDTLVQLLKENRFSANTQAKKRKKTRLSVEPGKSVSTRDQESDTSEDEIAELSEHSDDHNDAEPEIDLEEVDYIAPQKECLQPETFVLVQFVSGKRHSVTYKYVCRVQERFSEDEFTVVGLKSVDHQKRTFKIVPKDVSTVPFSDILAILPVPVESTFSSSFDFLKKVDVCEL